MRPLKGQQGCRYVMMLDTFTIVFMAAATTFLIAILLGIAWYQDQDQRLLGWWSASYLLKSAGCILILLRGSIADPLSIDLANALILVGAAFAWGGSRVFDGRHMPVWTLFLGAVVWLVACRVPAFYDSFQTRAAGFSALYASYCAATAYEFWRGRADALSARYMLVVAHAIQAVLYGIRVPATLILPPPAEVMAPDVWFGLWVLMPIMLGIAAAVLVVAITMERALASQRAAAAVDTLTGALNRGALIEAAAKRLRTRGGPASNVAMLVFDLDCFKQINDRFGHATGDRALRVFADVVRSCLRVDDIFGRLGGEEFAVLLPGAGESDGLAVAERIRAAYSLKPIEHGGIVIRSTVSVGVAAAQTGRSSVDQLLAEADKALYRAKHAGRDRVVGPLALAS
ncbi:GGDEF domain-containing protein [Tepidamorphus gemmatus]|nr:GGDEF domain-containing protein [Tepidamorphus gemmatus]